MERFTLCPRDHAKWCLALLGLAALLALLPAGAGAEPGKDARDVARDRVEVRQGARETASDVGDVRRLENLVRHMDDAHARGDGLAEDRYRREVRTFLLRKTAEDRRDVAKDRRDLRQSSRELRADRRDARQDRRELSEANQEGSPAEARDARTELKQDRRDRRQDRQDRRADARDLAGSRNRFDHERDILAELRGLEPDVRRGDARAEARERQLLGDFISLTKQDARSAARETRQDRRELPQDRQDRRKDLEEGGAAK